jgi:hypothetical protein
MSKKKSDTVKTDRTFVKTHEKFVLQQRNRVLLHHFAVIHGATFVIPINFWYVFYWSCKSGTY